MIAYDGVRSGHATRSGVDCGGLYNRKSASPTPPTASSQAITQRSSQSTANAIGPNTISSTIPTRVHNITCSRPTSRPLARVSSTLGQAARICARPAHEPTGYPPAFLGTPAA